jgi:molecular chaperone GrpE
VASVLADFQSWLSALPASSVESPPQPDTGPDLFTLLGQLTAVRQEINLQTKTVRAQQEQNALTLTQLTRALDTLQQARASDAKSQEEQTRPLLKTLVDLYDALAVASREAQRVQEVVLPAMQDAATGPASEMPEPPVGKLPRLARWLGIKFPELAAYRIRMAAWQKAEEERVLKRRAGLERVRQLLASLTTGYTMGLQRIERALKQHGLQPVPASGQLFDPERMEAVEAVMDSGLPSGQVIDEVQRGYLWNGRVFRFAKVRVAKGSNGQ